MVRLSDTQARAVHTTEGPLLVLAGAGSGKTRVITHRVAHLLDLGVPPPRIMAVTFTNKAAGEMRERLAAMVGPKVSAELVVGTFHRIGASMLRLEPDTFGVGTKKFSILDQGDVYGVVRSLLREHGHHASGEDRRFDLGAVVQRVSLWKNELVTDVQAHVVDEYDVVAASIWEAYEDRLRTLGAVDFDDLVCLPARVLGDDAEARQRWQDRIDYLLVDEYQDVNAAQVAMLRGLCRPPHNLCVVGDDDQAIYGWRGARVENILGFAEQFPGATVIKLQENYRSRGQILSTANSVVRHNQARHEKELQTTRGGGDDVMLVLAPDGAQEAAWVGRKIRRMVVEEHVPASQIAVLYRSTRQAAPIEEELQAGGVPYRVLGGQSMFDKKEVKDAQAYLKALVLPRDEIAVRRALETPPRGIGRTSMERLVAHARARNTTLLDAVDHAGEVGGLPARTVESLARFSGMIRHARGRMREAGTAAALSELLSHIDLRDHVVKETGSERAAEVRWQGVSWLLESLDRYEKRASESGGRPRWAEYLGHTTLDSNNDTAEADERAVTLATLHSAKGLEWDHVFIVGVEEGTLPHRRVAAPRKSDAIAGDLEEERRLFYVGITRARERLWISRAQGRSDRGREIPCVPSRFLDELPAEGVRMYEIAKEEELTSQAMGDLADAFLSQIRPPDPA